MLEHAFSVHWALLSIPSIREKENHWVFIYFKIGFQYAACTGLKLIILLPQPPGYYNYRHVPLCLAPLNICLRNIQEFLLFMGKKICLYVCVIAKNAIDDHGNSSYRSIFLGSSKILKKNSFDVFLKSL